MDTPVRTNETKTTAEPRQELKTDLGLREQQQQKAPARESGTREGRYFEPAVDIYESDEALIVRADVPGALPEDVETHLEDSLLTITATVRPVEEKWRPAYQEYAVGHYQRQFRLGQQIDQTKISAALKDGVLTLTLPKVDTARPRRIQVKAE